MRYAAFISYSHAADEALAPKLQQALHNFAKPWYQRRALRVFRDKTSLAANPALWPAIESALGDSLWFLYMASPQAAQSIWVQKEIEWWLRSRGSEKMLILLTDGELNWNSHARDFDWSRTTCVPECLRNQFKDEPLYVDLRWARSDANLSVRHLQFRGALLDIAAPLHGKPKEDLDGEDVRQHRRNRAWAWSAGSALAALAIATTASAIYAIQQRNEALHQRDEAVARQLRSEAQRLAPIDDQWTPAILLMIESLRRAEDATSFEVLWQLTNARAKPLARYIAKRGSGALAFSPDGRMLATGDTDAIVIVDARNGSEVARMPFAEALGAIGFSSDGKQLVAGGEFSVRLFEIASGREIARLDDGSRSAIFGFSPDRRLVAIASGSQVRVIDVFAGRILLRFDHDTAVQQLFLSAGGTRLGLVAGNKVWLFDTATASVIPLPARSGEVSSLSFSANGKYAAIAAYGKDDGVVVVDAATGLPHTQLSPGSGTAWFSRQDDWLATEPQYPNLQVRDIQSGVDAASIKLHDAVARLEWSDDGELLVLGTGERDGSTSVFQVGSWRPLARFKHQGSVRVEGVAINPQAGQVASTANRVTTIFAAHEGLPLIRMPHPDVPARLTFSADSRVAAGVFQRNIVIAAAAGTSRQIARFEICDAVRTLSLSADGQRLALGCTDNTGRIIEVPTGKTLGQVAYGLTTPLAISPDGKLVFSVSDGIARISQAEGGREVQTLDADNVASAVFSPDARYVAVAMGGQNGAAVFETSITRPPLRFNRDELVESIAFSADGRLLALGTRSRTVHVHELETQRRAAILDHKEEEQGVLRINSMVFSADSRTLATVVANPTLPPGERGGTLHVFDLDSKNEIVRVPLAEIPPLIRFSGDHAFVEFATGRRQLRIERVPLRLADLIENSCARVSRNLTPEEWSRYFGDAAYHLTCPVLNPAALEIP